MISSLAKLSLLLILTPLQFAFSHPWTGKKSKFDSFEQTDFKIDDLNCKIVSPKKAAKGNPWIWRARFWGHEPQTDIALLKKGFHVAYCNVGGLYGAPSAVERWDRFCNHVTKKHQLSKKVALEGMSRGGLIIFNWAAKNPEKVSCIYTDNDKVVPVSENTAVIEKRYLELKAPIKVIHKPGVGHHPHSLKDPKPIVDFILKHTGK